MAFTTTGKDKLLRHSRLFVSGYDLSGDTRTVGTFHNSFGEAPTWGISDSVYNFLVDSRRIVGIDGVQVLLNDTAASGAHTLLKQVAGTPADSVTLVSWLFGGGGAPVAGDPAYTLAARQFSDIATFDSNIGMLQVDFKPDQTNFDSNALQPFGVSLAPLTSNTSTTNFTSADNAASSANGGQAIFHVHVSSGGSWAFLIEDGTDDSAWATFITIAADASAIASEHQTAGGTVNQYVRLTATRTSGTCSVACSFARN